MAALSSNGCECLEIAQLVIVAGEQVESQLTPGLASFLRSFARRKIPISAIGTATWLLATTGLLEESACTIHWSKFAAFSETFPRLKVRDSLYVKHGRFSTCAGELSAFDLAVDLVAMLAGAQIAQEVCRHATVEGQRRGSNRQKSPPGIAFTGVSEKLIGATMIMEENVEESRYPWAISRIRWASQGDSSRGCLLHIWACRLADITSGLGLTSGSG